MTACYKVKSATAQIATDLNGKQSISNAQHLSIQPLDTMLIKSCSTHKANKATH